MTGNAVITDTRSWLDQRQGYLDWGSKSLVKPVEAVTRRLPNRMTTPISMGMGHFLEKVLSGSEMLLNLEKIHDSVQARLATTGVDSFAACDAEATSWGRKQTAKASVLGAATGSAGTLSTLAALTTLAAELPALMALQALTIQGIAASYGYDPRQPHERLAVLSVLGLSDVYAPIRRTAVQNALRTVGGADPAVVTWTTRIVNKHATANIAVAAGDAASQAIVRQQVANYVNQRAASLGGNIKLGGQIVGKVAKMVPPAEPFGMAIHFGGQVVGTGIEWWSGPMGRKVAQKSSEKYSEKLIARKVASLMPVLGAVVGGSFNAWYTSTTAQSAQMFYRVRWLADHSPVYTQLGLPHPLELQLHHTSSGITDV